MTTPDDPNSKPMPSVADLQYLLRDIGDALRTIYGERSAVLLAIGIPNGAHDRFASYSTGPCLMERGLLHWAVPKLEEQMAAHITEPPGSTASASNLKMPPINTASVPGTGAAYADLIWASTIDEHGNTVRVRSPGAHSPVPIPDKET